MADLTLRVNSDFSKAQKAFEDLANSSEETRQKIEKYASTFNDKKINEYIDKQKLLTVSMTGTKGEVAALQTASNNYNKEIERLIKSGLNPEHEAIIRLRTEQQKLNDKIKEANDIKKAQTDLMKAAEKAALACYAAIAAGVAAVIAMTNETAKMGDKIAKTSRIVGMSAETFQELQYAAGQSGIKDLTPHLTKLNKTVADVRSGTGALTKHLQENDKQLLNQLQNVKSNEEAFNLLMGAIKNAPDEFTRAELATAAFGKAGQELVIMAENGTEGIEALRQEAAKYGVMSSEAAKQSELYMDAQARLQAALKGVQTELTSKLLPGLRNATNKVADFIAEFDNWERVITTAAYVLAGLTAGLTAFLVITKGAAAIQKMAIAFKALNAAIAANPIGAIAVVITTVLIPALIYLIKNWDNVKTYIQQGIARLEFGFKWFGSVIKEKLLVAFAAIKAAGASLIDFIYGNIIRGVGKMLEVMGRLPFVGEMFQKASNAVSGLGNAMGDMAAQARQAVGETIEAARQERQETEEALRAKLAATDEAARARRAELEANKQASAEEHEMSVNAAYGQMDLLQNSLDERLDAIQAFTDEKTELELLANEQIGNSIDEVMEKEKASLQQRLQAYSTFFGGMSSLFNELGKENRAFAILGRETARVEAGINSALAFTQALASAPPPLNYIAAAGVMAAGITKQIQIANTEIPSAETGGRFIVPNSTGVDSQIMRVNPGESIDVTPRGMTGQQESFNFNFVMDGGVLAEVINKKARAGELYTLQLAGNL